MILKKGANLQYGSSPTEKYKGHPTPKPISLMERLEIQASSKPEDIVFDPCMEVVSARLVLQQKELEEILLVLKWIKNTTI